MKCQRCGSGRVAEVNAKCDDRCHVSIGAHANDDYVPRDIGIGGGDTVELSYCLGCGQIQGEWPLEASLLEIEDSESDHDDEDEDEEGDSDEWLRAQERKQMGFTS